MKNIYGYLNGDHFVETGYTEKGAKVAAKLAVKRGDIGEQSDLVVGYRSSINNMFIATGSHCHIMQTWLKVVYL